LTINHVFIFFEACKQKRQSYLSMVILVGFALEILLKLIKMVLYTLLIEQKISSFVEEKTSHVEKLKLHSTNILVSWNVQQFLFLTQDWVRLLDWWLF